MKHVLLVFLGGGIGSSLRYIIGKYLNYIGGGIVWGTFAVNVLGSLLIGIILGFALKNNSLDSNQTLLLTTGFCGGFTTFSTFAYENHVFLKSGDLTNFALYTLVTFVMAFAAVFIGLFVAKSF